MGESRIKFLWTLKLDGKVISEMGPRADLVCYGQLIRAIILPHHHFMVMMAINSLAPGCKYNHVCAIVKDILVTDAVNFPSLISIR